MDNDSTGTSKYFNEVIGYIEDIVVSDEFQVNNVKCILNIYFIWAPFRV